MKNFLLKVLHKSSKILERIHNKIKGGNTPPFNNIEIGKNSNIENCNLDFRIQSDKKYFIVGENSVINGTFIFENENGKVIIGANTYIGASLFISINEIEIGNEVMISWGCTIIDNNSHPVLWEDRKKDITDRNKGIEEGNIAKYKDWSKVISKKIQIKDKAWIGINSIILKGVTIGEGSVVSAGSVVTENVPDFTVVGGNPARIIKSCAKLNL